jgi:hypothetical protein
MLSCFRGTIRALWQSLSLVVILSVVATIPILQFASLGYMLECAARVSRGWPLRRCFPGSRTAGRLSIVSVCVFVSWLPVWFITDLAYTGEIIEVGSTVAGRLRLVARIVSAVWVLWILWAIYRGGKIRHFLWPAPVLALKSIFRRNTWLLAENRLWEFVSSMQLLRLMWLGVAASIGAVVWLVLPGSFIVIGLSIVESPGAAFVGLIGALGMAWVLSLLPFLQGQMARELRFTSVFDVKSVRGKFRKAPWTCCIATWATFLLAIPLYLLRIEPPPPQLWWILSLFFVLLMFPAKLCVGWSMGRSERRHPGAELKRDAFWVWRYLAWLLQMGVVFVYLGVLYLAKFALWEGAASIYLQHAFLPPVPFFVR